MNEMIVNTVIILSLLVALAISIELINIRRIRTDKGELVSLRMKKLIGLLFAILGGIPLISYPFVLIANIMSSPVFLVPWSTKELFSRLFMMCLIIITTSYPLIYISANIVFFMKGSRKNLIVSVIPVLTLIITILAVSTNLNHGNLYYDNGEYKIANVKIYKNTPAWHLAKAVDDEKIDTIKELVSINPNLINSQDDLYGATPLFWAVETKKYKSAKTLLELGADPDIFAEGERGSPLLVLVER